MRLPRASLQRYTPFSVLHQNKASLIEWTTRAIIIIRDQRSTSEPNGNISGQRALKQLLAKIFVENHQVRIRTSRSI